MALYEIKITLKGPLGSRMMADTFWGHLVWAINDKDGPEAVTSFLQEYAVGDPPIIFSDAIPSGFMPRPLLPLVTMQGASREDRDQLKRIKKSRWIPRDLMDSLALDLSAVKLSAALSSLSRRELPVDPFEQEENVLTHARVSIDRTTGGPLDGALFSERDVFLEEKMNYSIFVSSSNNFKVERLRSLIDYMGLCGFGRDASVGAGAFEVERMEEIHFPGRGTTYLSLCHFIPDRDMNLIAYDLYTKYGRVGRNGIDGRTSTPFKHPVTFLTPGSVVSSSSVAVPQGAFLPAGALATDNRVAQYGLFLGYPLNLTE